MILIQDIKKTTESRMPKTPRNKDLSARERSSPCGEFSKIMASMSSMSPITETNVNNRPLPPTPKTSAPRSLLSTSDHPPVGESQRPSTQQHSNDDEHMHVSPNRAKEPMQADRPGPSDSPAKQRKLPVRPRKRAKEEEDLETLTSSENSSDSEDGGSAVNAEDIPEGFYTVSQDALDYVRNPCEMPSEGVQEELNTWANDVWILMSYYGIMSAY